MEEVQILSPTSEFNDLFSPLEEIDFFNEFEEYETPKITRNKKKNKKPKVNSERFQSSWEEKKEEKKQSNLSFHYTSRSYSIPVFYNSNQHLSEDEQFARALYESMKEKSFVPLNTYQFDQFYIKDEKNTSGLSLDILKDLQTRDLTPEDYELLLRLDEQVSKKTIHQNKVESFETLVIQEEEEGSCSICMCEYEKDEIIRVLPCKHKFHKECIDHWLTNNSTKCPLDGISLE